MKQLGRHFGAEIEAAGLGGLPISWTDEGYLEHSGLSPEQVSILQSVYDAHDHNAVPAAPAPVPQAAVSAMAELRIVGEDIEGVATSCNIAAAFMIDVGLFWIMFTHPEPDDSYLAFVQSPGYATDVMHRETDYFEVAVTNRQTAEPAIPERLSISVQRVK